MLLQRVKNHFAYLHAMGLTPSTPKNSIPVIKFKVQNQDFVYIKTKQTIKLIFNTGAHLFITGTGVFPLDYNTVTSIQTVTLKINSGTDEEPQVLYKEYLKPLAVSFDPPCNHYENICTDDVPYFTKYEVPEYQKKFLNFENYSDRLTINFKERLEPVVGRYGYSILTAKYEDGFIYSSCDVDTIIKTLDKMYNPVKDTVKRTRSTLSDISKGLTPPSPSIIKACQGLIERLENL